MRTFDDLLAILATPTDVPSTLSKHLAEPIREHYPTMVSPRAWSDGSTVSSFMRAARASRHGELHDDMWVGVARAYDLDLEVVLTESPKTIRALIDLGMARAAHDRALEQIEVLTKRVERNARRIETLSAALPAHLVAPSQP